MKIERIVNLSIDGVKLIQFGCYFDDRGAFCEPYRESVLRTAIPDFRCVQVNHSWSCVNVLRGLHLQIDQPMGKLVRVLDGQMYDLCVDLRVGSPTYLTGIAQQMSPDNTWILVPPGVAHGNFFPAPTQIEYLCTAEYNKAGDYAVNVFDDDITWTEVPPFMLRNVIQSEKDKNAQSVRQFMEATR